MRIREKKIYEKEVYEILKKKQKDKTYRTTENTSRFIKKDMFNNINVGSSGVVTQDELIKAISKRGDIDVATVRNIFKTTEDTIFAYLSSTTPDKNILIKLLDGLSIECKYIPAKTINTYDNIQCDEKIWAKPKITRHYNRKLNRYFDK